MTDLIEHTDQIKKPPGRMMRGRKAHGIIESTEVTDLTDHTDEIKKPPGIVTRGRKGHGMLLFLLCEIYYRIY